MKRSVILVLAAIALTMGSTPIMNASGYTVINHSKQYTTVSAIGPNCNYTQIKITKYDNDGHASRGRIVDGPEVIIGYFANGIEGPDGNYYNYRAIPTNDTSMRIRYFFNL